VADLPQSQGHDLQHFIASGWKTKLTVQQVLPDSTLNIDILGGTGPNLPDTIVVDFDFGDLGDFDYGGPQAYALRLELLRLAMLSPENKWMQEKALG
jgi:hypothetical protein